MATSEEVPPSAAAAAATQPKLSLKKRGSFGVLVASVLSRNHRPDAKKKGTDDLQKPSGRVWKSIICGLRPLHQLEQGSLTPRPRPVALGGSERFHDVALPPISPRSSASSSLSSQSSRYASASDLQALDVNCAREDHHSNAIDMQAEEFIAKFYEQMKLQRLESTGAQRGA